MPKSFELLEHTGDIRIRVWGKNAQELFKNAYLGMLEIIRPEFNREKSNKRLITVESTDSNSLLIDFLNEMLYKIQTEKEVYRDLQLKISGNKVEVKVLAYPLNKIQEEIKAVTFHQFKIKKKNNLHVTEIVFDV